MKFKHVVKLKLKFKLEVKLKLKFKLEVKLKLKFKLEVKLKLTFKLELKLEVKLKLTFKLEKTPILRGKSGKIHSKTPNWRLRHESLLFPILEAQLHVCPSFRVSVWSLVMVTDKNDHINLLSNFLNWIVRQSICSKSFQRVL
ncbi:unnamed protein product [Nesidiocoris tenuis]|uniref:Uncharacterized protein n=1 Tax=Nesidiocoris tenuis TaxID=355587 RepID=A0A6H5HIC1_9HEMI|nr:unnamed protein product [Nesidiocoris tenuis]